MANDGLKAIAAAIDSGEVSTILPADPEVFMAHADLFNFVKGYFTEFGLAPTREIIRDKTGIDVPEGDGHTEHHLKQANEAYVKHKVGNLLLAVNGALDTESATAILSELTRASNTLQKYTSAAKDVNMTDVENAEMHLDKLRNSPDDRPGIKTGFKAIDSSYPTGMMGGQSLTVIGYAGYGKSLFTAKLAVNVWRQRKRVLVFSLEMSPEEYRERVYALMAEGDDNISMSNLATGKVSSEEFKSFAKKNLLDADDFIIVSNEGRLDITPDFIQSKIDMYKCDFLLLDYLQLFSDSKRSASMQERMMNLSREIKLMAMSNDIPIMSISSVTDLDGKKRNEPPQISQAAHSRAIEFDSSLAIAVHRHVDTNLISVLSRKVRNGAPFDFVIDVDFDKGIWTEKDTNEVILA